MQYEIQHKPSFSLAIVSLGDGESVVAESGAMVSMQNVEIQTAAKGGLFGALKRKVLGGESFFQNTFTAGRGGGEVTFAPNLPGDIVGHDLRGETLLVTSGCYLASDAGVEVDTKWGGAKTFFSREGLFVLKCSGTGLLLLSCYGAIWERELARDETMIVDTGHMVAWEESVGYAVRKVGGLKSTLFSGEGLVVECTGPGRIWMQTRSEDAFLSWLLPKIPTRN